MKHRSQINHDHYVVCERCGETCAPGQAETEEHGIPRRVGWFCRSLLSCWTRYREQLAAASTQRQARR